MKPPSSSARRCVFSPSHPGRPNIFFYPKERRRRKRERRRKWNGEHSNGFLSLPSLSLSFSQVSFLLSLVPSFLLSSPLSLSLSLHRHFFVIFTVVIHRSARSSVCFHTARCGVFFDDMLISSPSPVIIGIEFDFSHFLFCSLKLMKWKCLRAFSSSSRHFSASSSLSLSHSDGSTHDFGIFSFVSAFVLWLERVWHTYSIAFQISIICRFETHHAFLDVWADWWWAWAAAKPTAAVRRTTKSGRIRQDEHRCREQCSLAIMFSIQPGFQR